MASCSVSVRSSYRVGLRWQAALLTIAAAASSLFSQPRNSRVSAGKERSAVVQTDESLELDIHGPGVLATDGFGMCTSLSATAF